MTKLILALEFKWYKSNVNIYYFINEETREFIIAIVYVMILEKPKSFLGYISYNCKDWKIFVDQFEYLNKVLACFNITTNLLSTSLLISSIILVSIKSTSN